MRRNSRDRLLVGLLGSAALAVGCSRLTAPDWGLIQASSAGTSTGATDTGGEPAGGASGGTLVQGGEAGELNGGEAGEAGGGGEAAGGSAGADDTGGRGGAAASGGVAGGGRGGAGGTAGSGGNGGVAGTTGSAGAPACTGTPGAIDDAMVLFAGPAGTSGARGGRAAMDAACEAERVTLSLPQTTTHAFITIGVNDFVGQWGGPNQYYQSMPLDRRIVGPTGIQLASTFGDLLDGYIEQSLVCAKVVPVATRYWLTGNATACAPPAVPGGPIVCGQFSTSGAEDTCNGWTLGTYDPIVQARYGSTVFADPRWLTVATSQLNLRESCDVATEPILCLAYTP